MIPFDGLATYIIFLIGLPALVIGNMSPEIRRVVTARERRWRLLLITGGWFFLGVLVVVIGVAVELNWPYQDGQPLPLSLAFAPQFVIKEPMVWATVFGLLVPIAAIASVVVINLYGRRAVIVQDLGKEVARKLRVTGRLDDASLKELLELGRQSDPGQDKELVLDAIFRLADETCRHPKYRGDSLEALVLGLVEVVAADPLLGNSQNFDRAEDILEHIVMNNGLSQTHDQRTGDVVHSVHVLSVLGRAALRSLKSGVGVDVTLSSYVQALELVADRQQEAFTEVSQALLEIGIAAIQEDKQFIAIDALDKLCTLVQNEGQAQGELVDDLFGLMSYFWVDGATAHDYICKKVDEMRAYLALSQIEALRAAQARCAQTSHFETADNLRKMMNELYLPEDTLVQ